VIGAWRRRSAGTLDAPPGPGAAHQHDCAAVLAELGRVRVRLREARRQLELEQARAETAEVNASILEALAAQPTVQTLAPSDTWQRRALRAEAAHRALLERLPTIGADR
jgi:hypothetical protein